MDRCGRSIREAEVERPSLRAGFRSGLQLQASANEFSDIDGLGLSSRINETRRGGKVIVGGSDVLKKLKDDHLEFQKLEEAQQEMTSCNGLVVWRLGRKEMMPV